MTVWDIARMIPVFTTYMETDLKVSDIVSVAVSMLNVDSSKIMMAQVPVYMGQLYYNGNDIDVVDREAPPNCSTPISARTPARSTPRPSTCGTTLSTSAAAPRPRVNVQFMGTLNEEVVDAQQNNNLDGTKTTDVYQTPAPEPSPDPAAEGGEDGADGEADDAA